jgi:threonine dehydratase
LGLEMIGKAEIELARDRIADRVRRTPVLSLRENALANLPGTLSFKLESCQVTGSFKPRGVFNRVLSEPSLPRSGLVAASGGNHAVAVAFAARTLGLPCEVFLPSIAPATKREQLRGLGARVSVVGNVFAEALEASDARAKEIGALSVHPFDHPAVVAGQGTLAAELEDQLPNLETVLVAVGGGGLIGGMAAWYAGRVRLVAVEPEGSPSLAQARQEGRPVDIQTGGLAADSLGCRRVGTLGFDLAQRSVDRALVVSEAAIRKAQRLLWDELRIIAEPGGAVALAALVEGAYVPAPGERVGVILCGGNTDPASLFAERT